MVLAYYNENDPFNAQWLRNLIAEGAISPGEVDDRSITDVTVRDLQGFTRHHFFAGIGLWDYALTAAGWPENTPIWTGSCPCQPWSRGGAIHGAGKKFLDDRHLLPEWLRLIQEYCPDKIVGEQVSDAIGAGWWDSAAKGLEKENYAVGGIVFEAGEVGEPIPRERLYLAAKRLFSGAQGQFASDGPSTSRPRRWGGKADLLAVANAPFISGDRWPEPLVRRVDYGYSRCVGPLHAIGNAINVEAAVSFITAFMGSLNLQPDAK